jgi:hypothetical protein
VAAFRCGHLAFGYGLVRVYPLFHLHQGRFDPVTSPHFCCKKKKEKKKKKKLIGVRIREGASSVIFWGWLGFSALPQFAGLGWTKAPLALFLISEGGKLVGFLAASITYVELAQAKSAPKRAAAAVEEDDEEPKASPRRRGRSRSPRASSARKRN